MQPRIVIIDDEEKARNNIKAMLELLEADLKVIGEAHDVESGYQLLQRLDPDVVFLDIKMPDGSGFDLLRKLKEIDFRVVFITAFDDHALEAFRYNALDYLLKPIDPTDFEQVIQKIQGVSTERNYKQGILNLLQQIKEPVEDCKVVLKTNDSIVVAKASEIIRCASDRGYTDFYLNDGRSITVSQVLKTYEDKLSGCGFLKTHQSHLINPDYLKAYIKTDGGYILMKDGSTVPVSKRKKEELMRYLEAL